MRVERMAVSDEEREGEHKSNCMYWRTSWGTLWSCFWGNSFYLSEGCCTRYIILLNLVLWPPLHRSGSLQSVDREGKQVLGLPASGLDDHNAENTCSPRFSQVWPPIVFDWTFCLEQEKGIVYQICQRISGEVERDRINKPETKRKCKQSTGRPWLYVTPQGNLSTWRKVSKTKRESQALAWTKTVSQWFFQRTGTGYSCPNSSP